MSDPVRFLTSLSQALASMTLYAEGHPARQRAVEGAFQDLTDLLAVTPRPLFTFLGDETVFGQRPLRDLKSWDWGKRLALAGIQRLEIDGRVGLDEFEEFLEEVLARLTLSTIDSTEARQMRQTSIRYGGVGLKGETEAGRELPTATLSFSLGEEMDTLKWLQEQVQSGRGIPLVEAEAIVRSLSVAMHGGQRVMLPLLHLKEFDEYTTTHSLNVAVLAMALAEFMGMGPREVQALGMGGLLHDVGKTKIPKHILTKPGKLTPDERLIMNLHPSDGARLILGTERHLELAAVVAYEHHIMINGGGYPTFRYPRDCHLASRLVHVCDVYDALRTNRPYREAWSSEKTLSYLIDRAGSEFDADAAGSFVRMMGEMEQRVAYVTDPTAVVPIPAGSMVSAPS